MNNVRWIAALGAIFLAGLAIAVFAGHSNLRTTQSIEIARLERQIGQMTQPIASTQSETSQEPVQPNDIGQAIDDYIMRHPEVIEEALRTLALRRRNAAIASILDNPLTPIIGNPEGDVTLIEFFDYNCGYCRQQGADIRELIANDPNLKVALIELPILSPQSLEAARVSLAAYRSAPEKYEAFHFNLMLGGARADGALARNIATLNLFDIEEIQQLSTDPETDALLQLNYQVSEALEITGTPALYLDGSIYRGRTSREDLARAIGRARQNRAN